MQVTEFARTWPALLFDQRVDAGMVRVIVTDGEQRATLAVVRSLGRAGCQVMVTSETGCSLAGASRYAARDIRVPSSLEDPDEFLQAVQRVVSETGATLVVPISEPAILALLPARDQIGAVIPMASLESFLRASDKVHVSRIASLAGIRVPEQVVLNSRLDVGSLPDWVGAGAVLKPGRSVNLGRKLGVSYVPPGGSAAEAIASLPDAAFPLLVQERIVGPGTGVFLLRWNSQTLAAFAHRRIREKPPSGGVSVVRESVELDDELRACSEHLLDLLDWQGVAMLEFKYSANTNQLYLMEINGRFWGSLQLAIDAGVDFPFLLVSAALGKSPPPCNHYRAGVRSRWLLGDVDHLIARALKSRQVLNLPADAPGFARVCFDFVRDFLPPNRAEVFRLNDPLPFFREARLWMKGS